MTEQAHASNAAAARILCEMVKTSRQQGDEEIPAPVLHWFLLHRVLDLMVAESSQASITSRREITDDILWTRELLRRPFNASHHATTETLNAAREELRARAHVVGETPFMYGLEWSRWLA